MRFLCFHGRGANAKIFESQTAAIRYELGDGHTYEFVEGSTPAKLAPELQDVPVGDLAPLFYCDDKAPTSVLHALDDIDNFLETEGLFDGIIAFSLGAALVSTWMVDRLEQGHPLPFKCAIFMSAALPGDVSALHGGRIVPLHKVTNGPIITIPTAHLWGEHDHLATAARDFASFCESEGRSELVHGGGHDVPTSGEDLTSAVNVIRRCILLAQDV